MNDIVAVKMKNMLNAILLALLFVVVSGLCLYEAIVEVEISFFCDVAFK